MAKKQNKKSTQYLKSVIRDIVHVIFTEFRTLIRDRGVVIMLVVAPLAYPLLYCSLYMNETLTDVPVAAVDLSHSPESRELLRNMDATQNLKIEYGYGSLAEAEQAFYDKKVHGVVYIPSDFGKKLVDGEQATVSVYSDISSFMYYRIISQASTNCILAAGAKVKAERLAANGITGEAAVIAMDPIPTVGTPLFNEGAGFASFLVPIILILIIHQTLFLGIGMHAGTSREENRFHEFVSFAVHRNSTVKVVLGKSLTYFLMYGAWSFFVLGVIPRIFNLPHIGLTSDIIKFMIPFLFATVFFSMTISVFLPNRETSLMLFMFFSLILVFTSGVPWPQSNINIFWKIFAWMIPSSSGVQSYVKVNTMGATIREIRYEYVSMWIQTGLYFLTTCLAYRWQIKKSIKNSGGDTTAEVTMNPVEQ
mgnify:CR=1 FL=1